MYICVNMYVNSRSKDTFTSVKHPFLGVNESTDGGTFFANVHDPLTHTHTHNAVLYTHTHTHTQTHVLCEIENMIDYADLCGFSSLS